MPVLDLTLNIPAILGVAAIVFSAGKMAGLLASTVVSLNKIERSIKEQSDRLTKIEQHVGIDE